MNDEAAPMESLRRATSFESAPWPQDVTGRCFVMHTAILRLYGREVVIGAPNLAALRHEWARIAGIQLDESLVQRVLVAQVAP